MDGVALAGVIGGLALGGANVAVLAGVYMRLGRLLAITQAHNARLDTLEEQARALRREKVIDVRQHAR